MIGDARAILQRNKKQTIRVKMLRKGVFDQLFPRQDRMEKVTGLIGFISAAAFRRLLAKSDS
ncbi:hypothetical protein [Sporolactobacillus shoreicorticis]|uniref:hypothetical protein n=1 Tax=Sporolactobacillus shoreicorticis TaxID=1923877 RepID=UPI00359FD095